MRNVWGGEKMEEEIKERRRGINGELAMHFLDATSGLFPLTVSSSVCCIFSIYIYIYSPSLITITIIIQ